MKLSKYFVIVLLLIPSLSFSASPDPVTEYAFAQKCYHSIDKTNAKGWDRCIVKFKAIVDDYPKSDMAPKALFSVGRLYQEKFEATGEPEDLQKAFETYNTFLKNYPKDPMADDTLFRIGTLRFEKQHDKAKAEHAMKAIVERYPDGDMQAPAQKYLDKLGGQASVSTPAVAPILAPVAATVSGPPTEPVISTKPVLDEEGPVLVPTKAETPSDLAPVEDDAVDKPISKNDFEIKTVVIDPGHGGDDPGAIGPDGTHESVVALQIARKLSFKLKNDLNLKTYLTRTTNKTLTLEERNKMANKVGADLFISIHANASESSKLNGVETFYLNNATNKAATKLAARENKSAGKKLDVSHQILSTMLQNANTEDSRDLAREVHNSLVKHLRQSQGSIKDLKVDSALFYVLVGAKSPSILVETSFITNPKDEKRLKNSDFQWSVAEGITQGIKHYVKSRQKAGSSL